MREFKNYTYLKVYQVSRELSIDIHTLPKFELYEEGGQLKRQTKSIPSTTKGGQWRRNYKNDFIRYTLFVLKVDDMLLIHLKFLSFTNSTTNSELFNTLSNKYKTSWKC
ncbi:MAG TPA: four helix bundle protein [Cytophagaceae bacterium]|jgi:hypothetical protein|nr:four helix bundle protein [Cytophagaceae bacterium]